jgi:hypothetical protein
MSVNAGALCSGASLERDRARRATLRAMRFRPFFFAYFWFSHRTGGGEASA